MKVRLMFVHALSPVHAGTGQSVGAIDLAIARDRATGFPYIPGSSVKGSLRDRAQTRSLSSITKVFGPEADKAHEHAGALIVGDANLLLLPVRSVRGTYAWVTSPYLLARYARDAHEAGLTGLPIVPTVAKLERGATCTGTALAVKGNTVIFEDLDFEAPTNGTADAWAAHFATHLFDGDDLWASLLKKRLCVVHDDAMSYLAQHATDIVARISIEHESKTVKKGGLWYEENLPAESILVALMGAQDIKGSGATGAEVFSDLAGLCDKPLQLGGNATVGRGRCALSLSPEGR